MTTFSPPSPKKPRSAMRFGCILVVAAWLCVSAACAILAANSFQAIHIASPRAVRNYRVEGVGMEPTLHDGQYLLGLVGDACARALSRADVIVFIAPEARDRAFLKRVIGLPGETVEVRQERVLINGVLLTESYRVVPATYAYGPQRVGANELFVLGDNRENSLDSHIWGMLPCNLVLAQLWLSYWPPQSWGFVR